MRDLTKILRRSNLTARERGLLVARSRFRQANGLKGGLSDADIEALRNQKFETSREVDIYNGYVDLWNHYVDLTVDTQTAYLQAMHKISQLETLAQTHKYAPELWQRQDFDHEPELREFLLKHSGIEYTHLLYVLTFNSLPKEVQQNIQLLDEAMPQYHDYWSQEVQLADILTDNDNPSEKEIELLAEQIVNHIPWNHELDPGPFKISVRQCAFNLHYGSYPLEKFAVQLADRHNIEYETIDELKDTLAKRPNLKHEFKTVVCEAIASGLFVTEETPLCNDDNYSTHNGKTTQLHCETMHQWCAAMKKTELKLQKQIAVGTLELATSEAPFFEATKGTTYVTGRSLIQADPKLSYVAIYKKQVDKLLAGANLFYVISLTPVFTYYSHLLAYKEVSEKIDQLLDEGVSKQALEWITEIKQAIHMLYMTTNRVRERTNENIRMEEHQYLVQTFFDDVTITLAETQPQESKSLKLFEGNVKKALGVDWPSL
jgi:hypothetical protein